MGKLALILLIVGLGGLVIIFPLICGGTEYIVNSIILRMVQLNEGTYTWKMWKKVPFPVTMKVRVFNITNPDELPEGGKPILNEVGPYVFSEWLEKFDTSFPDPINETDTVRYRQVHTYYFDPERSNGTLDDLVTFINIPFVAVAKMAHDFTDVDFMLNSLDDMLSKKGEKLMRTHPLRELLFDGFSVQAYLDLINDPLVQAVAEDDDAFKVPELIADGKMGLLKGQNGSDRGWFVVKRGVENYADFGRVISVNDLPHSDKWKDPNTCGAINGTDGMLFRPMLNEDINLDFFIPQMCRTLNYLNMGWVKRNGNNLFRYDIADSMFQNVQENPDNWCFCPEDKPEKCNITGIMRMEGCFQGAPLAISQAHFLHGDPILREKVIGLNPDFEQHKSHFEIHPRTGMTLRAAHRFQFNIGVQPWIAMSTFRRVQKMILPILWVEEGGDIDDSLIKLLEYSLLASKIVQWILLLGFLGAAGAGAALIYIQKKNSPTKSAEIFAQTLKPPDIIEQEKK